jgi:hypothetical protein
MCPQALYYLLLTSIEASDFRRLPGLIISDILNLHSKYWMSTTRAAPGGGFT